MGGLTPPDVAEAGRDPATIDSYRYVIDHLVTERGATLTPIDPTPLFEAGELL